MFSTLEYMALVLEKEERNDMIEFNLLKRRFREFGGNRLVKEYAKLGLVPVVAKTFCKCIIKRKSLRAIYPVIREQVCPMLADKYHPVIEHSKFLYESEPLIHEHPQIVWWCWLQGEEQAPAIVKACLSSLRINLPSDYEIRVIDETNWREWITLPETIVSRRKRGEIPAALFSDLIRLELLVKYGGTWIDSTVLCTGLESSMDSKSLLESDLFMFQYTRTGDSRFGGISNWFISAHSNNKVLMTMRDVLLAYWRDYDCVLDYYIFHYFFGILTSVYPSEIKAMPYAYSPDSLVLMKHWNEKFDQEKWDRLTSRVCFHKLSSRHRNKIDNSYYYKIINTYCK